MIGGRLSMTVPAIPAEDGPGTRLPFSVPFFEIGPKNMLRRPELHELLAAAQEHSRAYGVSVVATLPVTEIEPASALFPHIFLFTWHMDRDLPGSSVGRVIAEALVDAGADGVMLYEPRAMIGHSGGARRPWIPAMNALVRSIAPGTLVMHAGGAATVQEAGDVIHAGAAGTGATSAIIKASDRGATIEGFLRAIRNTWDADHPGPLRAR